ncbi:LAGLIDADG family homing endonuclease [Patescibacteria group bacterium]
MDFASYITGFVDGEGTFSVSFCRRSKFKTNIEVRPSFSISQHKRNLEILKAIKTYFNAGFIRYSKRDQNYKYEVRSINDLNRKIIPHFKKYPPQTSKSKDFDLFEEICRYVVEKKHLNPNYLEEIINKAYLMNESGKRKYKKQNLLRFIAR